MRIAGEHMRTIGLGSDSRSVWVIDQTKLPHQFETAELRSTDDAARAIKSMVVRGAPLIGATAAYGLFLAMLEDNREHNLDAAAEQLMQTRPTAVNLRWAIERMVKTLRPAPASERAELAKAEAARICDEDVEICKKIGDHGLELLKTIASSKSDGPLNILTHCNAGWLATIDWGTATAPIYRAQEEGIDVHVWVDETRPRCQGAFLTAYELGHQGIAHTLIADNAAGHVMQRGMVDACITGTDRTTRIGDVCNKIGTYTKALAAHDNGVPFFVALPSTTIDWTIDDGVQDIPIEQRHGDEVAWIQGKDRHGRITQVRIAPEPTACGNFAFDVTPARLVSALITERGVCAANANALESMFNAQT